MPTWLAILLGILSVLGLPAIVVAVIQTRQLGYERRHRSALEAARREDELRDRGAEVLTPVLFLLHDASPWIISYHAGADTVASLNDLRKRWLEIRTPLLAYANGHPTRAVPELARLLIAAVEESLSATEHAVDSLGTSEHAQALDEAVRRRAWAERASEDFLEAARHPDRAQRLLEIQLAGEPRPRLGWQVAERAPGSERS